MRGFLDFIELKNAQFRSVFSRINSYLHSKKQELSTSRTFLGVLSIFLFSILLLFIRIIFSKTMKRIFKNLVEFLIIGLTILVISFFLLNSIPGSSSLENIPNEQARIEIMEKYHLSDPLVERFWYYLSNLFNGNLGISTSFIPGAEINSFIWDRFLTSMTVGSVSLCITLFLGIPLGVFAGMSRSKIVDSSSAIFISLFVSIPSIIFAIFLLTMGKEIGMPYIYSRDSFVSWILPSLSLGISPAVFYMRYIKTEMNREINSMHARFAAIKGVSRMRFVWLHALRPSLFPIVTYLPFSFLGVFLGGLFTEQFFQVPGSGGLLLSSIKTKDINIVNFLVVLYAATTILAYSIRDILYALIDPRVTQ